MHVKPICINAYFICTPKGAIFISTDIKLYLLFFFLERKVTYNLKTSRTLCSTFVPLYYCFIDNKV